jgi:hypothetical protein
MTPTRSLLLVAAATVAAACSTSTPQSTVRTRLGYTPASSATSASLEERFRQP